MRITRRLATALFIAIATSSTGCGGDGGGPGPSSIAGTYTLATVNGGELPFVVANVAAPGTLYRLEVLSGRITLNADGTFSETTRWRETENGTVTTLDDPYTGTYTRSGSAITLDYSDGDTQGGTLSGNTLSVIEVVDAYTIIAAYVK